MSLLLQYRQHCLQQPGRQRRRCLAAYTANQLLPVPAHTPCTPHQSSCHRSRLTRASTAFSASPSGQPNNNDSNPWRNVDPTAPPARTPPPPPGTSPQAATTPTPTPIPTPSTPTSAINPAASKPASHQAVLSFLAQVAQKVASFVQSCLPVAGQLIKPSWPDVASKTGLILAASLVVIVLLSTIDSSLLHWYVATARRVA